MNNSQTYLANQLDSAGMKVQYDEHVRKVLSDKGVLAYILMYAVEEFNGYSFEEAKDALEGEPEIACRTVYPSANNVPEAIMGQKNESTLPGEGTMFFDIVFFARTKGQNKQKYYINIEAQKSFYPGYDLVTRGIVYGTRLVSEQMDVEYTSDNYDGVKKVYSIWLCMNTPKQNAQHEDVADTLTEYAFTPKRSISFGSGKKPAHGRYDLISVVFICMRTDDTVNSTNKLIGMLSTLLSPKIQVQTKKEILENKYKLPMSKKMEQEVVSMCNLSYAIEENAREEERKANEEIIQKKDEEIRAKDEEIRAKDEEIRMLKEQLALKQNN